MLISLSARKQTSEWFTFDKAIYKRLVLPANVNVTFMTEYNFQSLIWDFKPKV